MSLATERLSKKVLVQKRSGDIVDFDPHKIVRAISGAFSEYTNGNLDDFQLLIHELGDSVESIVRGKVNGGPINVEEIQDFVELQLMSRGYHQVAQLYIRYRERRKLAREKRLRTDGRGASDLVHMTKYARYDAKLGRREVFNETVDRVKDMHLRRYPNLADEIEFAFELVHEKRVLPSMRSMQYAGKAIETNHARIYNCTSSLCNRLEFFQEAFYLGLCGCGVGYSVQFEHVECLPVLEPQIDEDQVVHHEIDDSIEGWADAAGALIDSFVKGYHIEFAYHKIRSKGSRLKIAGGKAPGHIPLKNALGRVASILRGALGRKLRPIECHDIMCHFADAVLAGGNRESAMIALFSPGDWEMQGAKTGDWYKNNLQRERANNSMVLLRSETSKTQLEGVFRAIKEWGEPGFFFTDDKDITTNPCVEISKKPIYVVADQEDADRLNAKYDLDVVPNEAYYGWQFCNLSEINAAAFDSWEDFERAAKAAAIIGTLQAGFVTFPYLGWVSEEITSREALLGVSMTGMMDSPKIALDPEHQRRAAKIVVDTNVHVAGVIGINRAARTTCVKPAGSTSIICKFTGSGHHAHHARRYFRRFKMSKMNEVYQYFREHNSHMCTPSANDQSTDMVTFCVEAPADAIVKSDLTAVEFLKMVRSTQNNWVKPGNARPESTPHANHNVSNTCIVQEYEWADVMEYVWSNRQDFTGVSFIAATGDKDYVNAPFEAVVTAEDEAKWNYILEEYKEVDYSKMSELQDNTTLQGEIACSGPSCEIVRL